MKLKYKKQGALFDCHCFIFILRCDQERLHIHEFLAELQVFRAELQDAGD